MRGEGEGKGTREKSVVGGIDGTGLEVEGLKGVALGTTGEAERSAEKNKGQKSEDEPMGEEVRKFLKFWEGEPMGRGEYFGVGGVWGDDGGEVEEET